MTVAHVKYEEMFIHDYMGMLDAAVGLARYCDFESPEKQSRANADRGQ